MTASPLLTVIIPTYQRRDSVLRALASLRTQALPPATYEVIAVVDGSTDGTAEALRRLAVPYPLSVLDGPNRGRAVACNRGIRAAAGAIVVLLDDDMEASPGFLSAHARAHEGPAQRAVVGAAPIVVGPDSPPFVRYMADGFRKRLERLAKPGYQLRFRDAYTGNFSARRDALLAIAGFDETFRVYGHEDYELALRLQHAGVELTYQADACAYQHYEKSFAAFAHDGIARGRTAVLFAGKHPAVTDHIKISEYGQGPWRWRVLRGLLLRLSRLTDRMPGLVVTLIERLERYEPVRLHKYYTMAIDYFFWYGALAALREQRSAGPSGPLPLGAQSTSRGVGET
jgi:GT2 family glycosyltransferase